jgi:hypothetical protein
MSTSSLRLYPSPGEEVGFIYIVDLRPLMFFLWQAVRTPTIAPQLSHIYIPLMSQIKLKFVVLYLDVLRSSSQYWPRHSHLLSELGWLRLLLPSLNLNPSCDQAATGGRHYIFNSVFCHKNSVYHSCWYRDS